MIKVLKPGLQTTIQDKGRVGYYEIGMPPSGAFDQKSYMIANMLVGNDLSAAVLETTYVGPSLEFQQDACISLTGATMQPRVNGNVVPMWETVYIKSGDVLTFDQIESGVRGYIAVSGGFDVPIVMGSRSTFLSSKIGGLEGRALKANDCLNTGDLKKYRVSKGTRIKEEYIPKFGDYYEVRIMDGLCSYRITEESKKTISEADWVITPDANRVGYRIYSGKPLAFIERKQPFGAGNSPSNVVDVGYPIGSIQVPDVLEPIILFKDAVTCGGYATIATIISVDLNIMAQAATNNHIKFSYVTMEEALQARDKDKEFMMDIENYILQFRER
jgi:biotin-dependent carboxylase-like uncharacterized protein